MTTALLILHFCVTIALIGVVLIQRSEGGGLGIGSSQGMGLSCPAVEQPTCLRAQRLCWLVCSCCFPCCWPCFTKALLRVKATIFWPSPRQPPRPHQLPRQQRLRLRSQLLRRIRKMQVSLSFPPCVRREPFYPFSSACPVACGSLRLSIFTRPALSV